MARFWFLIAIGGQWLFAYYVLVFYGGSAISGDFAAWTKVLPKGIIAGDMVGNAALTSHLFLAFYIIVAGPLQLIPQIRARLPVFHRWNGRIYLPAVVIASIAGLWMVWTRKIDDDLMQNIGISLDAILIMVFAVLALRYALARKFTIHRRWALRLFLVVNAVWFFRIGLMFWLLVNQGPVGIDFETFSGPFLTFLGFAQTLVPLALLELYFRAQASDSDGTKLAMSALLLLVTLAMSAGIFAATMGLWLPHF
jgi:hypothetical protein